MSTLSPIRVAPGGRYFETFDGQPFLFLGPNDAVNWPSLNGLYRRRDIAGVESYLQNMAENGVNMLRIMLEYAHVNTRFFERPAGRFNPSMIRLWDDLFARCERFGIRVLLAPWDNYWMALRWHHHPYNAANGGPAQSPQSFFTEEETIAATIRRLQFVVERWGGCGAFAAWDLFNEIHPYYGGTPGEQGAVITRLSEAVREAELRMWGYTRPQTVSIFGPEPEGDYEELIFRHPCLDFASTHIYHRSGIDRPKNTVIAALTMAQWVRYALDRTPSDRPFTDSEHGPIDLFNNSKKMMPEEFDDEYERHMMWAHLASGGAGCGMRWPARHPHVITAGTRRSIGAMTAFIKHLEWRCFAPRNAVPDVELGTHELEVFACRDDQQAVVWLLRKAPTGHCGILPRSEPLHNVRVTVRGLVPGEYSIMQWDTRQGHSPGYLCATTDNERTLHFTLPVLQNDLALAVRLAANR
ncbi:MAG TPA: hypothetical protein VF600_00605 [Abditibacteriaceae bacterium]